MAYISFNQTVKNKHIQQWMNGTELSGAIICMEMYDGRVNSVHGINRLSRPESWTALGTALYPKKPNHWHFTVIMISTENNDIELKSQEIKDIY